MRLLVTGGCGFIGSNFIRHILREHPGWEVVNLDKLTYAGNPENLRGIEGNYSFVGVISPIGSLSRGSLAMA